MDIDQVMGRITGLYHSHTPVAIGVLVILLVLAVAKPKAATKLLLFALVMGVIFYMLAYLGQSMFTGVQHKDTMIHKSEDVLR